MGVKTLIEQGGKNLQNTVITLSKPVEVDLVPLYPVIKCIAIYALEYHSAKATQHYLYRHSERNDCIRTNRE